MSTSQPPLRSAFVFSLLIGGALVIIGLVVGFGQRQTSQFGGAQCGSVLGGGGDELTTTGLAACAKALSTSTTWTWLLLAIGALVIVVGLVINAMPRASQGPRPDVAVN